MAAVPEMWEEGRPWTNGEVVRWAQVLQSRGVLVRGAKTEMAKLAPEHLATFDGDGIFARFFEPEALNSMAAAWQQGPVALLDWWKGRLTAEVFPRAAFPVEVVKRHGARGLVEAPQVIVGTIHSVKGGQADIVYLFPDLSQAGADQYARPGVSRDAVIRVAYVGATRARERLVICKPESAAAVTDIISPNV
jgi:hypothetical protein